MELISAYADDELADCDKLKVEEHINKCESCSTLLDIYREIAVSVSDTSKPVPDALRIGVMNRVLYEDIPRVSESKNKRSRFHFALTRLAPIAACLVVGLILWQNWGVLSGGRSDTLAPAAAPEPIAPAAADAAPEPVLRFDDSEFPEAAEEELQEGATSQLDVVPAPMEAPAPTDAPAPMDVPVDTDDMMIGVEPFRSPQETERIMNYISNASAEISVTGKLPEFLADHEPQPFGSWFGWEMVYEIPSQSVPALLSELGDREGVSVTYYENDSAYAVVMYSR